jgi:hypothetical protein
VGDFSRCTGIASARTAKDHNGAKRNPSLNQIVVAARAHKTQLDDVVDISVEVNLFRGHREMIAFLNVNIAPS